MEQRIIMPQAEIDTLWETWGMGDYDRALQNIELERRRLVALLAAANEAITTLMLKHSFATGHGDTIADLLKELDWQIATANERAEKAKLELEALQAEVADWLCREPHAQLRVMRQRAEAAERQRDEMLIALNLGKRLAGESPVQTIMRLNDAERRAEETARDAERYRWLRSWSRTGRWMVMQWQTGEGKYLPLPQEDKLDAALDAARNEEGK